MKRDIYQRGLRTPRPLACLLGVLHGRLEKTAAVNPENGQLMSGYIEQKQRRLDENAAAAVVALECGLRNIRMEMFQLLSEERALQRQLEALLEESQLESDRRQADCIRRQRTALQNRLDRVGARLLFLRKTISSRELCCTERLMQASARLQRLLAAYAHGALRCPATAAHIPPISVGGAFTAYQSAHQEKDI